MASTSPIPQQTSSSSSSSATPRGPTPLRASQQQQVAQQQFSAAAATRPLQPSTLTPQSGPIGYQQTAPEHHPAQSPVARPAAATAVVAGIHGAYPDPHAIYLNLSCFDFLLIELVSMSERVVEVIGEGTTAGKVNGELASKIVQKDGRIAEEGRRGAVFEHVEGLGYRVGQGLAER